MMELPRFRSYGQYSGENYGAHTLVFSIGSMDVYFSYKTPVAFQVMGHLVVVRENDWGPTTGKHLNWIDNGDKKTRLAGPEFQAKLAEAIEVMQCAPTS